MNATEAKLKPSEREWIRKCALLKEFISKTGREPKKQEAYKGENLGTWCNTQRTSYRKGTLSKDRYEHLLKAGINFTNKHDCRWHDMYELLCSYKRNSDFRDAETFTVRKGLVYEGENLGNWCHAQTLAFGANNLQQERVQLLRNIGYCLEGKHTDRFWKMQKLTLEYCELYDRTPKSKEVYKGEHIGQWYLYQRRLKKAGLLKRGRAHPLRRIEKYDHKRKYSRPQKQSV